MVMTRSQKKLMNQIQDREENESEREKIISLGQKKELNDQPPSVAKEEISRERTRDPTGRFIIRRRNVDVEKKKLKLNEHEQKILQLWHDPTFSSSFSNTTYFQKALKKKGIYVSLKELNRILRTDPEYVVTRPVRVKFERRHATTGCVWFSEAS